MAPLSDPRPGDGHAGPWPTSDVDLAQVSDAIAMRGLRMLGRASGENLLEWPLGEFSQHRGHGHMTVVPPPDRSTLLARAPGPARRRSTR